MINYAVYDSETGEIRATGTCRVQSEIPARPGEGIYLGVANRMQQRIATGEDGQPVPVAKPPPSVAAVRANLRSVLAEQRWQIESQGISLGGVTFLTDDRSKLLLLGAADQARRDSGFTTRWKTPAGWVTLTADQLIAAADAVLVYVQACFAREAELAEALEQAEETADLAALASQIAAFWPPAV